MHNFKKKKVLNRVPVILQESCHLFLFQLLRKSLSESLSNVFFIFHCGHDFVIEWVWFAFLLLLTRHTIIEILYIHYSHNLYKQKREHFS